MKNKFCKSLSLGYKHFLSGKKGLKGQFGIMEYILLSVFLIVILIFGIFMLSGFEQLKTRGSDSKDAASGNLLSMNIITHSDLFTKKDGQLDDSKLQGFVENSCEDFEKTVGQQACVEIEALLPSAREDNECNAGNYPECNKWVICDEVCTSKGGFRIFTLPVNIYRKIQDRVDLGILTFKVPS